MWDEVFNVLTTVCYAHIENILKYYVKLVKNYAIQNQDVEKKPHVSPTKL